MSEDKRKICSLLLPVVQATRAGWDVIDLEYTDNEFMDDEYVRIRYASCHTRQRGGNDTRCYQGIAINATQPTRSGLSLREFSERSLMVKHPARSRR